MRERVKKNKTNLHQKTFITFWLIYGIFHKIKVLLWNRVENIVANGEFACNEQFLPLPQCFEKSPAAIGVKMRPASGKGF